MATLAINGGSPVRTAPWIRWPQADERALELVTEVLRSGHLSDDGPMERQFAADFASFCTAAHGVCVANGTVSLRVALEAAGVQAGDEVIVPGLTWVSTAGAVVDINAVPIFVDVDPESLCLDPTAAAAAITDRTRAIIPVHLSCAVADMSALLEVCRRHNTSRTDDDRIWVIEDCAHSHGAQWRLPDGSVRGTGSMGDIGSFSFQSSKSLSSGDGGLIVTLDEELADRCWSLRNVGRARHPGQAPGYGNNYRLSELQAAVLRAGLERLPAEMAHRQRNADYLTRGIADLPGLRPLARDPRLVRQAFYGYIIRYDAAAFDGVPKATFLSALKAEGIFCAPGYLPVYEQELWHIDRRRFPFASRYDPAADDYDPPHCPVAEQASHNEVIALPQPLLLGSQSDMDDVLAALTKLVEHRAELVSGPPMVLTGVGC